MRVVELKQYQFNDPSKHVKFGGTTSLREMHGCAVCKSRPKEYGRKCRKAMKPEENKAYCRKFSLER